jgi:crotonobetainyl-CoA:carnitine CoA-transferase CaiB-like acyl-CoA transferase
VPVGIVFAILVLIPNLILVAIAGFDGLGPAWNLGGLALVALTAAGTIALARAFVTLGGEAPDSY